LMPRNSSPQMAPSISNVQTLTYIKLSYVP
jgi:hypothetical protein